MPLRERGKEQDRARESEGGRERERWERKHYSPCMCQKERQTEREIEREVDGRQTDKMCVQCRRQGGVERVLGGEIKWR